MEPQESRHCNRAGWASGAWDDEPDRVEWRIGQFAALIVRNRHGALCGYVGVTEGHPWHGKHFYDVDADCHGGLTFSDKCHEGGKICHVPQPGESDSVWWLGFDCNHCGDLEPGDGRAEAGFFFIREPGARYWSIASVKREVEKLAEQARRVGDGLSPRAEDE